MKRERRLTRDFFGLAFDENHLIGFATRLKQLVGTDSLLIQIDADDGQESITFKEPEFFADPAAPNRIANIYFTATSGAPDMRIFVHLRPRAASFSVVSADRYYGQVSILRNRTRI